MREDDDDAADDGFLPFLLFPRKEFFFGIAAEKNLKVTRGFYGLVSRSSHIAPLR